MYKTKAAIVTDAPDAVDCETFVAVVVTSERPGVLRALTQQAVEHFRHDHLHVRDVRVVPQGAGSAFLATATFTAFAPHA